MSSSVASQADLCRITVEYNLNTGENPKGAYLRSDDDSTFGPVQFSSMLNQAHLK